MTGSGPLVGFKVVELAGLGPGPFCGMLLSDLGADVVRLDRLPEAAGARSQAPDAVLGRGRRSLAVDLKRPEATALVLDLVAGSHALIEGFRPGVMERLGLGPDVCCARNSRLVYARVTGWGQDGPYAPLAGHDLNYIALAGALDPIGRAGGPPVPPLNLLGDFGGGGMLLALGTVAALLEAERSGRGQVVDAAMVDGSALLMTMFHGLRAAGHWSDERGSNFNDTGAHFYEVYETADGRHVAVAAIEPRFYAELLERMGLDAAQLPEQEDRAAWPVMKHRFAEVFRRRPLDEWCERMAGSDACFAPVLALHDAPEHPHNVARGTFAELDGVVQPAPAPRFSRTAAALTEPPPRIGQHTDEVLAGLGLGADRIAELRRAGVVA